MRRVRSSVVQPGVRLSSVVRSRGLVAAGAALLCLVLPPAASAQDCPNAAIRAAQGSVVEALPDCMALEMVSPAAKYVQSALRPNVSVDGERVSFVSRGGLGDTSGVVGLLFGDRYVASRGSSGWSTQGMSPPAVEDGNLIYTYGQPDFPSRSMSPDFSRWVTFAATSQQRDDGIARFFRGGLDGSFSVLSPLLVPVDGLHTSSNLTNAVLQAVSADHERAYFAAGDLSTAYLAGDPSPLGTGGNKNVYVAQLDGGGEPSLELLARDGGGTVWGGRCGARVGGVVQAGTGTNGRDQGAVSADGGRVLFMTRPGQSGAGVCNSSVNRLRIMERVEGAGGPQIEGLFASECVRAAPACSTADGDDLFQGASVDGTKVYFTSTRQLADSDLDVGNPASPCSGLFGVPGCDLYLYDSERPAGDRLVQVSAGDAGSPTPGDGAGVLDGIAAISADGSHAYFVASGVLTNEPNSQGASAVAGQRNLYSFTYDDANPDGRIAFVGVVNAADPQLVGAPGTFKGNAWPVPVKTDDGGVGDGRVLVFQSAASLTADDTDGGRRDYFRYDSVSGDLERLSRAAPGGSDNGAFDVATVNVQNPSEVGTAYSEFGRWVSDDADTLAFTTAEGLVAADTDGTTDTYVVRGGVPYLLPGTRDTGFIDFFPTVSRDGRTVAFSAFEPLLGADGDTVSDIYVARVDGGFEEQLEPVCDPLADECRGTGAAALDATSNTSAGGGNASPGGRGRVSLAVLSAQRRKALAVGRPVTLAVKVSGPGQIRVNGTASIAGKRKRVIVASAEADRAERLRIPVRLTASGRAALRNRGRLAVRLTVGFSDAARPAARTLRLAWPEKRPVNTRGPRR
jgi:WD40-like Beta Propeller Repeat